MANGDVHQVPESYGTTPCEYSVACTRQTNHVLDMGLAGRLPVCLPHIRFYLGN